MANVDFSLRQREQKIKHGGDVHCKNFSLSIGGKTLIKDGDLTLA